VPIVTAQGLLAHVERLPQDAAMRKKPIRYCRHLQERLVLRQIDQHLPEQIIGQPDRTVEDAGQQVTGLPWQPRHIEAAIT